MYSYNPTKHRQCVICNKQLHGRSDKRFCDIKCKNYYHSEVRKSLKTVQSETMKILAKNYVLLRGILGTENTNCKVDKLAIERLGFRFNYVTDAELKNGSINFGIFELNYRIHKKNVFIEVDKNRIPISPFIFERWGREINETPQLSGTSAIREST